MLDESDSEEESRDIVCFGKVRSHNASVTMFESEPMPITLMLESTSDIEAGWQIIPSDDCTSSNSEFCPSDGPDIQLDALTLQLVMVGKMELVHSVAQYRKNPHVKYLLNILEQAGRL